jgi:hypothetical protein
MRKRPVPETTPHFPGGSKSRVNRAGENVRAGMATAADLAVIEEWRAAHRAVLNTFQAILRERARDAGAKVAQRHKRKRTIFDKLERLPSMNLSRMDDVAGSKIYTHSEQTSIALASTTSGATPTNRISMTTSSIRRTLATEACTTCTNTTSTPRLGNH